MIMFISLIINNYIYNRDRDVCTCVGARERGRRHELEGITSTYVCMSTLQYMKIPYTSVYIDVSTYTYIDS